jgi:hypothetical protein
MPIVKQLVSFRDLDDSAMPASSSRLANWPRTI